MTTPEAIQAQVSNAMYPIITVLGLFANLVVVAVIVVSGKSKKNKTVANTFVLNLAIADIIFLISLPFYMPVFHSNGWPYGKAMCKILEETLYFGEWSGTYTPCSPKCEGRRKAIKHLCYHTSIVLLVAMNFDRYIAIVHSLRSLEYRTQRNARIVCGAIWILCFLLSSPLLRYANVEEADNRCIIMFPGYESNYVLEKDLLEVLGYGAGENGTAFNLPDGGPTDYYDYADDNHTKDTTYSGSNLDYYPTYPAAPDIDNTTSKCLYDRTHSHSKAYRIWEYSTFCIFFLFPILIISFCYISILYTARKRKVRSDAAKGMQAKITKMVAVLISAFIICWMPFQVWKLMTLDGVPIAFQYQCSMIDLIVALFAWSNSILNPILYSLMSGNFRNRAMMTLACLRYGYPSTIRQMSTTRAGRATMRNEETKMTLMQSQKQGTPSPGSFRKHSRMDSVESLVQEKQIANGE